MAVQKCRSHRSGYILQRGTIPSFSSTSGEVLVPLLLSALLSCGQSGAQISCPPDVLHYNTHCPPPTQFTLSTMSHVAVSHPNCAPALGTPLALNIIPPTNLVREVFFFLKEGRNVERRPPDENCKEQLQFRAFRLILFPRGHALLLHPTHFPCLPLKNIWHSLGIY